MCGRTVVGVSEVPLPTTTKPNSGCILERLQKSIIIISFSPIFRVDERCMLDSHLLPLLNRSLLFTNIICLTAGHVNKPRLFRSASEFDKSIHQPLGHTAAPNDQERSLFHHGYTRLLGWKRLERSVDSISTPLGQIDQ